MIRSIILSFAMIASIGAKQVLVTGGAGFLGSHLCERLLSLGDDVICLDNLSTGSIENISHMLSHPHFRFIQHDVTRELNETLKLDEIYSLACPASPPHYQKDPIQTFKTCILGAIFVLELARKTGATVFQASTSEIYGDPTIHPQPESYWGNVNPIGIRSCYDEGKRGAETIFFDYHRTYQIPIKVARIFNTYGPRMDMYDGRVVSNFIVQALKNEPITIYGSGQQTRSFCYVDDLIDAIILFMRSSKDVTGPLNIGNTEEFTMEGLAQKIIELTGSSSVIETHELPQDDPKMRRPNLNAVKAKLGWEPKIKIDQGLARTVGYFRKML